MQHAFFELVIRFAQRSLADDEDQVDLLHDLMLVPPNDLFHQTPHPVADDGIADFFAARHADAKLLYLFSARPIQNKLMIGEGLSVSIYPAEVSAVP